MATKMGPLKFKKNNNIVIVKNIIFPYHIVMINTSIYICCFSIILKRSLHYEAYIMPSKSNYNPLRGPKRVKIPNYLHKLQVFISLIEIKHFRSTKYA